MSCKCCNGQCLECTDLVSPPCCGHVAPVVPYKCVNPAPLNRSTHPIGNRYGCDLYSICPLPEGMTFDADQAMAIKSMLQSMMGYFHGYSVLNTGGLCDDRIQHGRDGSCTDSWMGGIYPDATANACSPTPAVMLEDDCASCDDTYQPVYRTRWTQTLPDNCCQIPVIDENGDPVLDADGVATTEPARLMFGAVPPSHPYLTEYGGTPNMPIDFDRIDPATSAKIAALFKKAISQVECAVA